MNIFRKREHEYLRNQRTCICQERQNKYLRKDTIQKHFETEKKNLFTHSPLHNVNNPNRSDVAPNPMTKVLIRPIRSINNITTKRPVE